MSDRRAAARLYRNARREGLVVAVVWALALVWTVGYCYLNGYQTEPPPPVRAEVKQVLGFPHWIFFGIMVPWVLCTAFTIWFGLFGMSDDELGADRDEGEGHGH